MRVRVTQTSAFSLPIQGLPTTTMLPAQGHDRTQAVSQVAGRHWGLEAGPGDAEAVSCKAKVKVLLFLPQLASHSTTSSSFV